jgi:3-oxoacyl-[acyl-carrier protein] reductase
MRLKNKVAIITGAGSGSGRAGAEIFSIEGAKVVVADQDARAGKETVEGIESKGGVATFVQVDVADVSDMEKMISVAIDSYGKLNILWNHAGIPGPGIIEDTNESEFDKAFAVNCKGPFFASKFAAPHMKRTGGGDIIFTSSISALRASPWSPAYAACKGGLIPLTMSLAAYLGPDNIRSNCICPSIIDSPMARVFVDRKGSLSQEEKDRAVSNFKERVPLGRIATPEDIAYAALFLASNESSFINGAIIPVDGGSIVRY